MFQHVGFHRIESVRRIGKSASNEKLLRLLHECIAFHIVSKLDRHTALVVRLGCRRGTKLTTTKSAQPGQRRPAKLIQHANFHTLRVHTARRTFTKISSAATASSSFTCSSVRVSAFMVVSHSCSAFISPRPLKRVIVKSFFASSTT